MWLYLSKAVSCKFSCFSKGLQTLVFSFSLQFSLFFCVKLSLLRGESQANLEVSSSSCVFCSVCDSTKEEWKAYIDPWNWVFISSPLGEITNRFSKGYSFGIFRFKDTCLPFRCNFCEMIIIQQLVERAVNPYIKITFQPSPISISDTQKRATY